MSDASSAAIRETRRDWIGDHQHIYLSSGGAEGHVMDLTAVGGHPFTTHCLIKYKGRKSGKTFIAPLICGYIGGEILIVGSKGGADKHPEWYLNILASETIDTQIATQAFRTAWREPEGAEYEKLWSFMVDVYPPYAQYQASTQRRIPIIALKPVESVAVFGADDATGWRQF